MADYACAGFDWNSYRLEPMYVDMLEWSGATLRRIFARLACSRSYPFLFHCSGGKDRTGVVAALLLRVTGVADETIVADYALSERYIAVRVPEFQARMRALGVDARGSEKLFQAPPEAMAATLAYLDRRYGSAAGYLDTIGVPAAHVTAFVAAIHK
jgi:protein-tyrosine phosphatase